MMPARFQQLLATGDADDARDAAAALRHAPVRQKYAEAVAMARWREVPDRVRDLYAELRPVAGHLLKLAVAPDDEVWYRPDTEEVWVDSRADVGRPPFIKVAAGPPLPDDGTWVRIKRAGFLQGPREAIEAPQRLLGGPSTLTSGIAGGLIGAGLGWGAGTVGDWFLPEDDFNKGRMPGKLMMMGGVAGMLPAAYRGSVNLRIPEAGDTSLSRFFGNYGYNKYGQAEVEPMMKQAIADYANSTGFMFTDKIPVDRFNRVIWNDAGTGPGMTPPQTAALVSGILAGASAAVGKDKVSIMDVARAAAFTGAQGYVGGMVAAKILGGLAGLKPQSQERLQQAGMWGGLITGAVNALFR